MGKRPNHFHDLDDKAYAYTVYLMPAQIMAINRLKADDMSVTDYVQILFEAELMNRVERAELEPAYLSGCMFAALEVADMHVDRLAWENGTYELREEE